MTILLYCFTRNGCSIFHELCDLRTKLLDSYHDRYILSNRISSTMLLDNYSARAIICTGMSEAGSKVISMSFTL